MVSDQLIHTPAESAASPLDLLDEDLPRRMRIQTPLDQACAAHGAASPATRVPLIFSPVAAQQFRALRWFHDFALPPAFLLSSRRR